VPVVPYRLALVALVAFSLTGCKEATLGPELSGSIEGRVLDFRTGAPVVGAGVTTAPPTGAIVTDEEGRFAIDDIPAGNYTITATRRGYRTNTATVSVRENRATPATLFLEEQTEEDATPARTIGVDVLNWSNRTRGDSSFVRIEYRVRNTGTLPVSAYRVYFRVETDGPAYFEQRNGSNLQVGQIDIANFEKFIVNHRASAVAVDTFWVSPA
jgi:hypothetical protein